MNEIRQRILTDTGTVWRFQVICCHGYNVPTLFRTLRNRFLTCMECDSLQAGLPRQPTLITSSEQLSAKLKLKILLTRKPHSKERTHPICHLVSRLAALYVRTLGTFTGTQIILEKIMSLNLIELGSMVLNATFNNISDISRGSVLLVEETARKPPTCRKSPANFITYLCLEYTSPERGSNSQRTQLSVSCCVIQQYAKMFRYFARIKFEILY